MLVPVEEHDGAGIVQLVHFVEIGDFRDVHQINRREVFDLFRSPAKEKRINAIKIQKK